MVDEEHRPPPPPPYKMVLVCTRGYCSLVISLNCSFYFFV